MKSKQGWVLGACAFLLAGPGGILAAEKPAKITTAPFPYVQAKAWHVLPGTHSEQSGYFSLSEAHDGRVHIGTAKYGHNAYLVEFDPRTERQRIVVDAHHDLGLSDTGYAAQAKFHTRNFVGPSGKVYVGTKQGYATAEDKKKKVQYAGGYVLTYDPRTGTIENLGMPYEKQGVIDVVADEQRGLLYVVTCEDQHWMHYDLATRKYRELGPMLTPYATTLIDSRGRANVLTKEFQLAQFDPATGKVRTRPVILDGKAWTRGGGGSIPTWQLAADGRTAYLILMNDATLLSIDLASEGETVKATSHGTLIEGEGPDSRCALTIAPDGRVYAVVRIDNKTGFGSGYLHHLVRFDPKTKESTDLGVLAIENPEFFDFAAGKKWTHGFHTLPDGTLTPLHHHMALIAGRDGTLYATFLYPFTLLRIDAFKSGTGKATPSQQYLRAALEACNRIEGDMDRLTAVGKQIADRYAKGGLVGFPWIRQTLGVELVGRSGGIMHVGFDRPWKKDRTEAEKRNDVAIFGWDSAPEARDLGVVKKEKERGAYVIGFGPKAMPGLREHVKLADAWFDTGRPADDRVVEYADGVRAGKINHLINVLSAWTLTGETVAALTRRGHMPTMWKSWAFKDGREWSEALFRKKQYHDDLKIAPVDPGKVGSAYLDRMRYLLQRFERTELDQVEKAAALVAVEHRAGRKTVIASTGHMAMYYVARYDDSAWATNQEVHAFLESQVKSFQEKTAQGALVVRLGETGFSRDLAALFRKKGQKVILITSENPYPENQAYLEPWAANIDMGYAFGDACVPIPGYPIRILPTSGAMQVAAYECLNVEVFARRGDK
jgi:uncharacterized phosphosugar-binding protein